MPSDQLQIVLQIVKGRPKFEGTVQEQRALMETGAKAFPIPPDVTCEPVSAGGVPSEWVSAPGAEPGRVVMYLHGGGYTLCSINTHREMIARIARASAARALAVEYRLAPEHPFPAAIEDATAAYRWLIAQGTDPACLVIAGDSAGGGLTVATLLALRDAGDPLPAAAVCISPWTDMEGSGDSMRTKADEDPMVQPELLPPMAAAYLGGAEPRNPLASPIYADLRGLPPLLIQVGRAEVLLDDSTRLAERATGAGVEAELEVWDGMFHVWHTFAIILPEAQQAIDRIGEFVRQRTGAGERIAAS